MDYGHTTSSTDPLESFTPDAGDSNFEAENNLDLTNQAKEWGQLNEPIEHDKQSLGNAAMNNPVELSMPPSTSEQLKLGIITENSLEADAAPEPYSQPTNDTMSDTDIIEESLRPSLSINKHTGHLSKEEVKNLDDFIKAIDSDLAGSYNEYQNLRDGKGEDS